MTNREWLLDYVEFNPTRFLKESERWADLITKKKRELESISELPSIESSGVQTSNIADSSARQAIQRLKITAEIEKLEGFIKIKAWAFSQLSSSDRELINGFFFDDKPVYLFVEDYGREHGLCRSDVYTARRLALEEFSELIRTKYYL